MKRIKKILRYYKTDIIGLIFAIGIISAIMGIMYIFGHCPNCNKLPSRGWGIEYCGYCGEEL